MSDTIEVSYNTRSRNKRNCPNFHKRLSDALISNIQSENENEEEIDEIDPFAESDDDTDGDYIPEEDASDIEAEYDIEANELSDSDEETESENELTPDDEYFNGKDGTIWKKEERLRLVVCVTTTLCVFEVGRG